MSYKNSHHYSNMVLQTRVFGYLFGRNGYSVFSCMIFPTDKYIALVQNSQQGFQQSLLSIVCFVPYGGSVFTFSHDSMVQCGSYRGIGPQGLLKVRRHTYSRSRYIQTEKLFLQATLSLSHCAFIHNFFNNTHTNTTMTSIEKMVPYFIHRIKRNGHSFAKGNYRNKNDNIC